MPNRCSDRAFSPPARDGEARRAAALLLAIAGLLTFAAGADAAEPLLDEFVPVPSTTDRADSRLAWYPIQQTAGPALVIGTASVKTAQATEDVLPPTPESNGQSRPPAVEMVEEEQFKPISGLGLRTKPPEGERPATTADVVFEAKGRVYPPNGFFHECLQHAPYGEVGPFCHPPLYFEDACLERYGQSCRHECLQPLISGVHFFAGIAALPYKACVDPPCRCVCTRCRYAGGCEHCRECRRDGFQWEAALFEAAVVGGLILAIP